jgi:hypothetical protein
LDGERSMWYRHAEVLKNFPQNKRSGKYHIAISFSKWSW